MCDRGADVRDASGTWCARHSAEGFETLVDDCGVCRGLFHPDHLDDDGMCSRCADWARDVDDAGLIDPAIGEWRIV